MVSIRKTKTKTNSTAVQIVYYKDRKVKILKHIGSGKTQSEIKDLEKHARSWIEKKSNQLELFPKNDKLEKSVTELEFIGVSHRFTYELLEQVADYCGLSMPEDRLLFDFAIMRLIEPASKSRTIKLLERYFEISYSERTVYRKILELEKRKESIESIAVKCAKEMLKDELALVLYDVTTLYFETFKSDELRKEGFSKDNKSRQPQIVVGLVVTRYGFPLSFEVFAGNTFEGKTMLSVLENFTKKNGVSSPIVVADAAMLSQENIGGLKRRNLSYIVGARLGNTRMKIIEDAKNKLQNTDGKSIRLKLDNSDLIVEFNQKRYRKDKHEMEKQLHKAKELIKNNRSGKRAKFTKNTNHDLLVLNESLIAKTNLLLGMKGYYTNIQEGLLSNKEIITRYQDLWHVEQAFRMAKSDLASRPVFHYKSAAVKSHILICFTALIIGKILEINTNLSLKQIVDHIWLVTDAKLYDKYTSKNIILRAKINPDSKSVIDNIYRFLSY